MSTCEGGHTNWVLCVSWSPTGNHFVSGGMDGVVCVWTEKGDLACTPLKGHTKWITSLAWEPMHSNAECTVFCSSSKDGTVRVWSRVSATCLLAIAAHTKCVTK